MNILTPITLTDALLVSSTIAEPAAGETAWVSAGTYALGNQRIRTTTHRIYECIQAHSGRTAAPEADPLYWEDIGPTNRWAPFDTYVSTPAVATTSATWVLSPSFIDALALYGLVGNQLSVTVKAGSGGATLFAQTWSLYEQATGLYEYLFVQQRAVDRKLITGLPLHPDAEVTVTLSGGAGTPVSVGMINLGHYVRLAGASDWGGTLAGASAEPITYSRITTNEFGETVIKRGHRATGLRAEVIIPLDEATAALRTVQNVLDVPVSWVATDTEGYEGLNVFGLGSASLSYESPSHTKLSITVKGMI